MAITLRIACLTPNARAVIMNRCGLWPDLSMRPSSIA
jgi:hypothetical protein